MNKPMTRDLAHCKTWIENALKYSGGTHDFWDIVDGVYDQRFQLWSTGKGCLVTEIHVFPKKKVINIFLGGGELAQLADMHDDVIAWAKEQGCSGASISGRKGWVRAFKKYGWRPLHTTIVKEFQT